VCGVIGFVGRGNFGRETRQLLCGLFEHSVVRGMHAYGMAYGQVGKPLTVRKSFCVEDICSLIAEEPFNAVLAHTRYSTSGDWRVLENNQPVCSGDDLLVFNGVVRMCPKAEYEKEFQEGYATDNDGEIILKLLCVGGKPALDKLGELLSSQNVSYAGVHYIGGKIFALRNENRPLWFSHFGGGYFVASTKDIFVRSGFDLRFCQEVLPHKRLALCP
jgi:glutamine phosphoribosylpyrophosphate amidotransferase